MVLREIQKGSCDFNLELETIDGRVTKIEDVDATLISVALSPAHPVLVPFAALNCILMECFMASGPCEA